MNIRTLVRDHNNNFLHASDQLWKNPPHALQQHRLQFTLVTNGMYAKILNQVAHDRLPQTPGEYAEFAEKECVI